MEKRVLLAVTLSFLVLAAYQYFFVKPLPLDATAGVGHHARPQRHPGPLRGQRTPAQAAGVGVHADRRRHRPEPVADVETLVSDTGTAMSSSRRRRCERCSAIAGRN